MNAKRRIYSECQDKNQAAALEKNESLCYNEIKTEKKGESYGSGNYQCWNGTVIGKYRKY